ncbi:MAG: hypothetical protein ABGY10_11805 [bacterium]
MIDFLVGWLNGWMVEWMDGWLVGWLVGTQKRCILATGPAGSPVHNPSRYFGAAADARLPGHISSQDDDVPVTRAIFQPIELFGPTRISPTRRDPHAPHPADPEQHGR